MKDVHVHISEKALLTLTEGAQYYNIGLNKLTEILNQEGCPYTLRVGAKKLIKRQKFEEYLNDQYAI